MENLEEKLRAAASIGDGETVEALIRQGINVNSRNKINGWTPLHWACKRGHADIAEILLRNGADPTITTNTNETIAEPNFIKISCQPELLRPRIKYPDISNMPTTILPSVQDDDIVLKIRISGSCDPDFIEVELLKHDLLYKNLLKLCCNELQCSEDQVERIRKLPNTRLRNDNDVRRLLNYDSLELVMKGLPGSDKPTNCYQSISTCKDQTILY